MWALYGGNIRARYVGTFWVWYYCTIYYTGEKIMLRRDLVVLTLIVVERIQYLECLM